MPLKCKQGIDQQIFADRFVAYTHRGKYIQYLIRNMCKFQSSQKDESRWQSTDSSKAYRNTSAFKYVLKVTHNQH